MCSIVMVKFLSPLGYRIEGKILALIPNLGKKEKSN